MANETVNQNREDRSEISASAAPQSAFCSSLRSKKFFMMDALPTEASQYLDASNHCWCRMTQQVIGPDGGTVHPESCVAGRSCYGSAFEA
ncbi:MAG TPA: hypothetical protein VHE60_09800 [Pyrinomonadaceae bacterium]|nr:hypothetical protein [Pyrinomonadaceae bacterium]